MLSNTYSKYSDTLTSFNLAVLMSEKSAVVYLAPAYEPEVINTFLLITNGLTARSALLLVISIYPDER